MISVTPVIEGLEPYELKIGGPENNQPQYYTLHALRSPDGRVMSRFKLSDEERLFIVNGADIFLCLKTDGLYPPTQIAVGGLFASAEQCREEMRLDDELSLRLLAQARDNAGQAYKQAQQAFEEKVVEVYGTQVAGEKKNG